MARERKKAKATPLAGPKLDWTAIAPTSAAANPTVAARTGCSTAAVIMMAPKIATKLASCNGLEGN